MIAPNRRVRGPLLVGRVGRLRNREIQEKGQSRTAFGAVSEAVYRRKEGDQALART
jgi:hypothetical protein